MLFIGAQVQEQLQQAGWWRPQEAMLAVGRRAVQLVAFRWSRSDSHLGPLIREVWVPAKLPPLLHVAVRHLRQGRRRRRRGR